METEKWVTVWKNDSECLQTREDGSDPTLEVVQENREHEDSEGYTQQNFLLYVFPVEKFKIVADPEDPTLSYLVLDIYDASWRYPVSQYQEWFDEKLTEVGIYCGIDENELRQKFCSDDPSVRASAYSDVAGYFGLMEFDHYPQEVTEAELDKRWENK